MSTVNAIINENKITAQTIQRLIKASVGSAEVSAEVTMTNAVVASYTGGQITENGEVKASFNQYAGGKMQISGCGVLLAGAGDPHSVHAEDGRHRADDDRTA